VLNRNLRMPDNRRRTGMESDANAAIVWLAGRPAGPPDPMPNPAIDIVVDGFADPADATDRKS